MVLRAEYCTGAAAGPKPFAGHGAAGPPRIVPTTWFIAAFRGDQTANAGIRSNRSAVVCDQRRYV